MKYNFVSDPLLDYVADTGEHYKRALIDTSYLFGGKDLAAQMLIKLANNDIFPDASAFLMLENEYEGASGFVYERVDELITAQKQKELLDQRKERWRNLFHEAASRMDIFHLRRT